MPKLSAYVADDLWEAAREVDRSLNPSQLIQTGLRALVGKTKQATPGLEPTPDQREAVEQLREKLSAEATELYRNGYNDGLDAASHMVWWQFDLLASNDWDLRKWISAHDDFVEAIDLFAHGRDRKPIDMATWQSWHDGLAQSVSMHNRGIVDALRDVWESVMQDMAKTPAAADSE